MDKLVPRARLVRRGAPGRVDGHELPSDTPVGDQMGSDLDGPPFGAKDCPALRSNPVSADMSLVIVAQRSV
jgi:hypothetical protein